MILDAISVGENPPYDVNVIVEVSLGGEPVKYEIDKASGVMFVDRFLHTSMRYPCNYGFIPHTLSDDGDPIDVLIASVHPVVPGSVLRVRPVGALIMKDEAGMDEKLLAVPIDKLTPFYKGVSSYKDLPQILLDQISHFFTHYKDLESNKWVEILRWCDVDESCELITRSIARVSSRK